jgi:23S rRNA (adenine2503-C2)-methyltransferase
MGCVFCATGQMGFQQNLSSGEIIEQVLFYARQLKTRKQRVSNIVIMGMGEPFHNYVQTLKAIKQLNHPQGFNLGARRFTISSVGLVPFIRRFSYERLQVNLSISLHAADNDLRSSLMPINNKYPLEQLIPACHDYVKKTNRRITFEWALIENVNDSIEDAKKLFELVDNLMCHVNIIPLNPTKGYAGSPTSNERALAFQSELQRYKIPCTIRMRRGIEIQAGCGQLATEERCV